MKNKKHTPLLAALATLVVLLAGVVLMDARSIAATARNHGVLTAATEIDYTQPAPHAYQFDKSVYEKR